MPEEIKDVELVGDVKPIERADVIVSDSKDSSVFLAKEVVDGKEVATAIQPQKQAVTPNAVYIPQVVIQTGIVDGTLKSSIQIAMTTANLTDGVWHNAGGSGSVYLSDIANLEEDIAHLSKELGAAYSNLVVIVAEINKIRQVI
jgi:hypothetical protein